MGNLMSDKSIPACQFGYLALTQSDNNKEVLIIGKTANPVKRSGTQVFAMKLDF